MTIMAQQKLAMKREEWPSKRSTSKEAIHSGHFMVSSFEAEAQDDEDELAVPVPETEDTEATKVISAVQSTGVGRLAVHSHVAVVNNPKLPWHCLSIETSLTKLFHCMSIAYRQKLTSPKWNRFKGIRLRWKDKIRLNNVIWRCWHMQFIKKKNTLVCQFASPLDADTHNKPEAVVLEGKYWKRKLNAVTAEYKKWRMFSHHQIIGKPQKDCQDMLAELEAQEWQISSSDSLMMVDEDYMGLMSDTLFSTITANQPFAFPDTREIARGANLADFIQPSLVQLQPNLDDYMDIEPLNDFLCSKLPSLPEEPPENLQTAVQGTNYASNKLMAASSSSFDDSYSTQHVWYLPPEHFSGPPPSTAQRQQQPTRHNQPEVPASYVPHPPPMPPVPSTTLVQLGQPKDSVFVVPKQSKHKSRGRNDNTKKVATSAPSTPSTQAKTPQNSVGQVQMSTPSAGQNNALLARLLTNASANGSFNYGKNEQTSQYNYLGSSPIVQQSSKNVQPLGSSDLTYLQSPYQSVESTVTYQNESELNKNSYLVSSGASSSTVQSSSSHPSSPQNMGSSSMIMKSVQPSTSAGPSSNAVCPESPGVSDNLSLSPLNVGSPTSPTGSKTGYKVDHRRVCHINAEQKRRCNIKNGFDTLHSLIPQLNQNPSAKMSKAAMLQKGADYIRQLQNERQQLKQEMDSLRQQIDVLNSDICNCQSLLPATGAPVSKHRSNKMRDMYRKYVRVRTHENWKFWILSLICEPLLESFNNNVSTVNLDELYRTTLQWVDQHCTLVDLRPIVLNALRLLCTTTEVLSDPASLANEARNSVDKTVKKS